MQKLDVNELYDKQSLDIMHTAENALERGVDRLNELKNYALAAGIKRIGIAHCISFRKEAELVKQFLSDQMDVYSIDCKCGKITRRELLGVEGENIMCNPAGQANYLKENKTELNVSMGLCIGHDMVFNLKSEVPVTCIAVKDRANKNNPIESINKIASEKQ